MNEIIHFRPAMEMERRKAFANPGPTPSNSPAVMAQTHLQAQVAAAVTAAANPTPVSKRQNAGIWNSEDFYALSDVSIYSDTD